MAVSWKAEGRSPYLLQQVHGLCQTSQQPRTASSQDALENHSWSWILDALGRLQALLHRPKPHGVKVILMSILWLRSAANNGLLNIQWRLTRLTVAIEMLHSVTHSRPASASVISSWDQQSYRFFTFTTAPNFVVSIQSYCFSGVSADVCSFGGCLLCPWSPEYPPGLDYILEWCSICLGHDVFTGVIRWTECSEVKGTCRLRFLYMAKRMSLLNIMAAHGHSLLMCLRLCAWIVAASLGSHKGLSRAVRSIDMLENLLHRPRPSGGRRPRPTGISLLTFSTAHPSTGREKGNGHQLLAQSLKLILF